MKRIIITGATGFVGANLTRRLLQDGHEIHLLVRPGYASWRLEDIRAHLRLYEVNLSDKEGLMKIVGNIQPEWVFHFAVYGAYPSQDNLEVMVETNIRGTINMVEACLKSGFATFVNTGSSSEYGFKDHAPSEDEVLEPNSAYAVTKASATLFCSYIGRRQNIHIPTLRLYSVFGPYEEPSRLIPALILRGIEGDLPDLVRPDTARDYVYVDDVIEAYILAASVSGQEHGAIYNVGTGIQTTLREAAEISRRTLRIKTEPKWGSLPNRSWDTNIWLADNSKIKAKLNWQPKYSFAEGFFKTVEWFANNPGLSGFYRTKEPIQIKK